MMVQIALESCIGRVPDTDWKTRTALQLITLLCSQ